MKKAFLLLIGGLTIWSAAYSQSDKISDNIYQFNERLGIGTNSAEYLLDIKDDASKLSIHPRQFIHLHNLNNSTFSNVAIIFKSGTVENESGGSLGSCAYSYNANPSLAGFTYLYSNYSGLSLRAVSENGIIKFNTAGNGDEYERMRIDSIGNIGIGTIAPKTKLQIAHGDVYISDIEKGIIMKSPDGNCWRGVIDNSGQLVFSSIDCPEVESTNNPQQLKSSKNIHVYPNPSKALINIDLSNYEGKKLEYKIHNLSGQVQCMGKIKSELQTTNISNLTNGTYMLSVYDKKGDKIVTQKIIKE